MRSSAKDCGSEEREARLKALPGVLDASIAKGGGGPDDSLAAALDATAAGLAKLGY